MKLSKLHKSGLIGMFALAGGPLFAQQLSVTVNGQSTNSQRGELVGGYSYVPLRIIVEDIGANVSWDRGTQSVTLTRGDTSATVTLDRRTATVNGQDVMMDAPARILDGVTMVPVRFISQAFGGTASWDPLTKTVDIEVPANQPMNSETETTTSNLSVQQQMPPLRFEENAQGWLTNGQSVQFTLDGAPGGQAFVVIPGLSQEIPMQETSPGHYVANWTPAGSDLLTVRNDIVMAKLDLNGQTFYSPQQQLNVDNVPPTVQSIMPAEGATISGIKPTVVVSFTDDGSGINPNRMKLFFNGQDVTSDAQIVDNTLTYNIPQDLAPGNYTVRTVAFDNAGNKVVKQWTFAVSGTAANANFVIRHARGKLMPGQTINFSLAAAPGSQVTVQVADGPSIPLTETSPGIFTGSYVIQDRDRFGGNLITANVVPPNAPAYTIESSTRFGVSGDISPSSMAPVIASPLASGPLRDPLVISGSAPPASTVEIHVSYTSRFGSHTTVNGSLADLTVQADTAGNFQTRPIQIGRVWRGDRRGTLHIEAVTVLPDGTRSPGTVLDLPVQG